MLFSFKTLKIFLEKLNIKNIAIKIMNIFFENSFLIKKFRNITKARVTNKWTPNL